MGKWELGNVTLETAGLSVLGMLGKLGCYRSPAGPRLQNGYARYALLSDLCCERSHA